MEVWMVKSVVWDEDSSDVIIMLDSVVVKN